MKKIIIAILFISSIISCQNTNKLIICSDINEEKGLKKKKESKYNDQKQIKIYKIDSIGNIAIGKNQRFNFKFILDKDSLHLLEIKIYKEDNLFQTIKTNKETYQKKYQFIDWNFDGYKDITVLKDCGATGMCTYWVWNYIPKTNEFIENKDISGIIGWEIDVTSKQLINHFREGANNQFWKYYTYQDEKLQLIKNIYQKIYNYDGVNWQVKETVKFQNDTVIKSRDSVKVINN